MRESVVEKHLVKRMAALGLEVRKVQWIARRHAPDRVVFAFGGIYIELKAPGEKARSGQLREHARMRKAGFDVRVLDTLRAVDAFADELERKLCRHSRLANTKN